jgi:uncharacterized protein (DUF1684 family)
MTTTLTNQQWLADWQAWHIAREKAVLAPHGIAANTGTIWLSEDPQPVAGLGGAWVVRDGRAFDQQRGLALAPGEEHLEGERLIKVIAPRPGTIAIRVFDPAAPTRVGLTGIETFAPDPAWIIPGRFSSAAPDATIAIQHFDGVTTDDRLAGTVHVDIAGQAVRLAAWPSSEAGSLELTFRDVTTAGSNPPFRFVKLAGPDSTGAVELDFNRAFLPPCALGAGYLCPIPPTQNRLTVAVEAGERFPLR